MHHHNSKYSIAFLFHKDTLWKIFLNIIQTPIVSQKLVIETSWMGALARSYVVLSIDISSIWNA